MLQEFNKDPFVRFIYAMNEEHRKDLDCKMTQNSAVNFCHVLAMENLARAILLVGFRDRHLIVLVVVDLLPGNMKSFFFFKTNKLRLAT
ncbi:hypothetical protein PRUPE_6G188200 [Prunus persica]|uniref:Uncharacterized protein n=1 Tax=Prunus persica TaxID=3760 RepID=M5WP17_PRUPE|nr:hypothetical protein PRUPE_6G188200 [Prunus persica]